MKHKARIARSGVQYYLDEELPKLLAEPVPREYKGQRVFAVYRPSFVLEAAKDKFVNAPVRVGHKWVYNAGDPEVIGKVLDDISIKRNGEEVALCASIEMGEAALPPSRELSPGYLSDNRWHPGTAPDGTPYDILCTGISEINHVAVVDEARGGKNMKLLDGGKRLMIHSGLIRGIKRRLKGVFDGKPEDTFDGVVDKISKMLDNGESVTDEMVNALSERCATLPDSDEKDKLLRYVADIPLLGQEEREVRDEALNCIKESYKSLDADAVSDITEKPMEETKKEEEVKVEEKTTDAVPCQDGNASAPASEPAPAPTNDASVEEQHGAEEHATVVEAINQLSEKMDRLLSALETKTQDAAKEEKPAESAEPTVSGEPPVEDGKNEGVNDANSLPPYTQSLGTVQNGYSLDDAFAKLKGRR